MTGIEAVILGLALEGTATEYELCVNDNCTSYECNVQPDYHYEGDSLYIHTPCMPLEINCNGRLTDFCEVNGAVFEVMDHGEGMIITGADFQ